MMVHKLLAYLWGGGLVMLSAWPALREPRVDSYPLSTYPMFSTHRGQPLIHQIVALNSAGMQRPLPPRLVANNETLQAAAKLQRAAREGKAALRLLCHQVAADVAHDVEFQDTTRLEVRSVRYDPISYFEEGAIPLESKRLMRCRVFR